MSTIYIDVVSEIVVTEDGGRGPQGLTGPAGNITPLFYEEWENTITPYVEPTTSFLAAHVLPTDTVEKIKKSWHIVANGTKLRYVPTGPLEIGAYRFDTVLNRILIGKGSTPIRYVEAIKYLVI